MCILNVSGGQRGVSGAHGQTMIKLSSSLSLFFKLIEFDLLYTGGEGVDVDHFNIRVYTRLRILGWFKWPNDDKFGGCVICIVVADLSPAAAQINPVGIRV